MQDNGSDAQAVDFTTNPVLFTGTPAAGSYPCVVFRMSDVIRFTPATSFGGCVAGTEYPGDIYRAGETDWKDVDLNPIVGHGTDDSPVDDHVTIVLTRNKAAAVARGFGEHQVIALQSDLVVPGQSTFYWNGQGSVKTDGTLCGIDPGQPAFR